MHLGAWKSRKMKIKMDFTMKIIKTVEVKKEPPLAIGEYFSDLSVNHSFFVLGNINLHFWKSDKKWAQYMESN